MTHAPPPGMAIIQNYVEALPEIAAAEIVVLRGRLRRLMLSAALVLQDNLLDEALSGGHPSAEKLLAIVKQEQQLHDASIAS
jgi:hypothetical protein